MFSYKLNTSQILKQSVDNDSKSRKWLNETKLDNSQTCVGSEVGLQVGTLGVHLAAPFVETSMRSGSGAPVKTLQWVRDRDHIS